jgi:hypothetical protein
MPRTFKVVSAGVVAVLVGLAAGEAPAQTLAEGVATHSEAPTDPCATAPSDGGYCSTESSAQWHGDVLFQCQGGKVRFKRHCAFGCSRAPNATEDNCNPPPPIAVVPVVPVVPGVHAHSVVGVVGVTPPPEQRTPREKAEFLFRFDFRAGAFYGVGPSGKDPTGAVDVGFQLGWSTWFTKRIGLLVMGGPELGYLAHPGAGALIVAGELGPEFQIDDSDHRSGTTLSVTWAPRIFLNFKGGEVGAPLGTEVAFRFGFFKIPFWFARTLDDGTFFGAGLGVSY